jgi:quercetin dioxygenase-like cupin family protein
MSFWDLETIRLDEFRPGVLSKMETGANLTMAFMDIAPHKEGAVHSHPFDQCGVVVEGEIEMRIGQEKRILKPMMTYFIQAGENHSWKTNSFLARIVDVTVKQS